MKKISNFIVNIFFIPLMAISIIGAFGILLNLISSISSNLLFITNFAVILFIAAISFVSISSIIKYKIISFIRSNLRSVFFVLGIALLVWQISIVVTISGFSSWDPGIILLKAMDKSIWVRDYFSTYSNTVLILLIEHGIWLMFSMPNVENFTLILNFINIILIDLGVYFLYRASSALFKSKVKYFVGFVGFVTILIGPWIALPYSDDWAFLLTSASIFLLAKLSNTNFDDHTKINMKLAASLAVVIVISYFIKPSLIITYIGAAIVLIMKSFAEKPKIKVRQLVKLSVIFILGLLVSFMLIQTLFNSQRLVSIDSNKREPMTHFIAMGLVGSGGYNIEDVNADAKIKNAVKRDNYNKKLIVSRLKNFKSVFNYQKFLISKQINNTSDGSFGWGIDGVFISAFNKDNRSLNSTMQRKLFLKNNVANYETYNYKFVAQLCWIPVLMLCLLAGFHKSWEIQFLKYSIVGFFLFLLIFEGGRSRYVIQFLPLIIVLAGFELSYLEGHIRHCKRLGQ